MLNSNVSKLINEQIAKELYSAYLYLDFSIYYEAEGLDGFANWYMVQAQEERDHAMLMLKYLQLNGEKVSLEAIDKLSCRLLVLDVTKSLHKLGNMSFFTEKGNSFCLKLGKRGGICHILQKLLSEQFDSFLHLFFLSVTLS